MRGDGEMPLPLAMQPQSFVSFYAGPSLRDAGLGLRPFAGRTARRAEVLPRRCRAPRWSKAPWPRVFKNKKFLRALSMNPQTTNSPRPSVSVGALFLFKPLFKKINNNFIFYHGHPPSQKNWRAGRIGSLLQPFPFLGG